MPPALVGDDGQEVPGIEFQIIGRTRLRATVRIVAIVGWRCSIRTSGTRFDHRRIEARIC
jgi:predicted naringenin-chalcone synthase